MKDSSILHRFNRNLLFAIGVIILAAIAGFYLFGKIASQPEGQRTSESDNQPLEENVAVPDDTAQIKPVREISADDHLWGITDAPVKLIVYDDFECPYCAQYYDTLESVKKEFGDKVVIAFRHYPLINIHVYSMQSAIASECAAEQGKFWEMYHQLFADNKAGDFNEDRFREDAKTLGLDTAKFNQCLDENKYNDKVAAQADEARSFNVNGTPTTFLNGKIIVGAYPFEDFAASDGVATPGLKSLIEKELGQN